MDSPQHPHHGGMKCFHCGRLGHSIKQCWRKNTPRDHTSIVDALSLEMKLCAQKAVSEAVNAAKLMEMVVSLQGQVKFLTDFVMFQQRWLLHVHTSLNPSSVVAA